MTPKASSSGFLTTFALVGLAMAVLFAADMFLAKTERAESMVEAARRFSEGRALMQRGDHADAIERIKDAIAIDRGNRGYLRTLAETQLAAMRTADAESTLKDLLAGDSTDGMGNLLMARVLVKEGKFAEAISYYHRAIYGSWDQDASEKRLEARFELIDLLARRTATEELLAELLPIQDAPGIDLKTRIKIGKLFLQAGSPARGGDVFRAILEQDPEDAEARAGQGEAEFARGDYRAAKHDFDEALRLAPGDQAARQRLELADQLLTIDPTPRGLTAAERLRRSLKLVEMTRDDAMQCVGDRESPELRGLIELTGSTLEARTPAAHPSEATERNLDLAEQIWQARLKECNTPPEPGGVLVLLMARLAR